MEVLLLYTCELEQNCSATGRDVGLGEADGQAATTFSLEKTWRLGKFACGIGVSRRSLVMWRGV
jgi:hypothetical protein